MGAVTISKQGTPEPHDSPREAPDAGAERPQATGSSSLRRPAQPLGPLLERLRDALATVDTSLTTASSERTRQEAAGMLEQLDDYVLPRFASLDAPLLAVVGGSTGAGKSTLVNSLIGRPVTRAGAIRPTTRQPILLHHPGEEEWFESSRILPSLARVRGRYADPAAEPLPANRAGEEPDAAAIGSLTLLAEERVPEGVALLDAPDIDSLSDENRKLAGQLLAAADLWIFVTTANRYADAVPWALLKNAAQRDITLAVVLDRVPAGVVDEIAPDLKQLLAQEGLSDARLFVVEEAQLDSLKMLPQGATAEIEDWLSELARDSQSRAAVARRTLEGVLNQLADRVEGLAGGLEEQESSRSRLTEICHENYAMAVEDVVRSTQDGNLLRGEVLARWQDFIGTGEFFRNLESEIGRLRDRIGAFITGRPAPAVEVETEIESGLHAVVVAAAAKAAERTDTMFRQEPAGRSLVEGRDLSSSSPGFGERASSEIRGWQGDLLELIRTEGEGKRRTARISSFGVNAVGVALMLVVFGSTGGLTGAEVGIAGGTAVLSQRLLESIFGDDAVRRLAQQAREQLAMRMRALMAEESGRFLQLVPGNEDEDAMTAVQARSAARDLRAAALASKEERHGENR
ncbi:dynamin family protein [Arthrobacter sp. UM1]|nr:dynamin family protein [Arthrobacter sp. UM1]